MTTKQFNESVKLASSYPEENTDCFLGCGLPDFKTVYCTLKQVAAFINYQARFFNGTFDQEELQSLKKIAKNKFLIIE